MNKFLLAILFAVLFFGSARAESAVVQTCGSNPQTYNVGATRYDTVDINGNKCTTSGVPAAGTAGAGYPPGATPITATASGTSGGTVAALPAAAGKFNYICGFTASPGSATAAITITSTVSGLMGSSFSEWVGAPVTAPGATGVAFTRTFSPCIQASAVNTAITVGVGALGAGGVNQTAYVWGYQQ